MSLTAKIAHNTFIQFGGKIVSTLLGVLTIAIMARYLGTIGFGQYSTIMAYLQFFGILVDLGLALTVVRLIADPKNNQQKIINNVFSIRFFSALLFLGMAPLVILWFPYDNIVKLGVALATLSFFAISLNQILIGLFQKELKMLSVTISEVSGRLILFVLVFIFVLTDKGLLAIVSAVVISSLITFLLNYIFAHKFVKISFGFDWQVWKKIIKTTWPIAISIAFNLVYFKADTIILSLVRSQAEVGIYNAPYRVLEILTNFIYMFMGIMFPVLTLAWAEKNFDKFKNIFQKTFDFLVILSVPMIFGTFFLAEKIILLIAGPEFIDSAIVLKIIIFATAIIFINSLFGYSIVVVNKQKAMVWAYVFVAIVALTGYLIFIPRYGYYGAAAFTIVSEALIFLLNFIVVIKTTKFFPSFLIFLKATAASLVMSVFLYFFSGQNVIAVIILASLIYAGALYVFKGYSKEMVLEILKIKSIATQGKINVQD